MEKTDLKENLSCAGCLNDIADNDFVAALGQDWHKDCFRCSVCDSILSTWYFEKSGLLFCQNDYWSRYGECCQQCAQVITGPVMAAGEHRFHPECFTCVACGSHIEDTESYALLERSKLYCGSCFSDGGNLPPSTVLPANCSHAIRSVHIPTRSFRAAYSDTGNLMVTHIDSSCGVLALHIGDRILEINGAPVRRQLDDIDRVLQEPETVVQLTIEHSPDSKNIPMCNPQTDIDKDNDHRHKLSVHDNNALKTHIPDISCTYIQNQRQDGKETEIEEGLGKKERLFKRKVDSGGKARVIKRRQTPSSPLLGDKERSSSMSKLLDVVDGAGGETAGVLCDLSRARSFRVPEPGVGQKVFRACDLLQGELLGSGFFGQVYKVTHRDTNEVMVLKQLYRLDEEAQNNFLKEVAVLRSLQHPNVLRFVGVLYKDKRLHLVTEYVAGGTLYQLLQDNTIELGWAERARLARDVAAGVGYLHRMNVIHRDLNSHNCLVREDKTVIVADFGLARIVQRTASSTLERQRRSHSTLRKKRYTVVGNPYWMAPEMMNGNVYDEKVDVFSFGIILCEIIGRVSADPDFLPRRMDFGLNEVQFLEQFCRGAPEPFYRIAFLACDLEPDHRPKFEVIEIWLESLVMHLSKDRPIPSDLLADILQYARGVTEIGHATPECCPLHVNSIFCTSTEECCQHKKENCEKLKRSPSKVASLEVTLTEGGVIKSKSNATMLDRGSQDIDQPSSIALGKCVSASHIWQALRPMVTVTNLSRSHHTLTGYILRADADGKNINITKVDDITKWLDPPQQLKRISPDSQLNNIVQEHSSKSRKFEEKPSEQYESNLPSFMRNQSVEGLETKYKNEIDAPLPFCRHFSIPDNCEIQDEGIDSDSSDEDLTVSKWYQNVSTFKMDVDQSNNTTTGIIKKVDNVFGKKSTYDVSDVTLRNPGYLQGERKINEVDSRRFNINYLTKNPMMAVGVKNIPKLLEQPKEKSPEKINFFAKKLLSPKLSRLFKPNTTEVVSNKTDDCDNAEDKSRSKFFIQRSLSPTCRSTYRIRPINEDKKLPKTDKRLHENNLLKSDMKLASMGKPMTPTFRRHIPTETPGFTDCRYSYRDRKGKFEAKSNQDTKSVELVRNRIKKPLDFVDKDVKLTPQIRSAQSNNIPALTTVLEKKNKLDCKELNKSEKEETKKREPGISRSNYVSLANLKINSKVNNVKKDESMALNNSPPVERVI